MAAGPELLKRHFSRGLMKVLVRDNSFLSQTINDDDLVDNNSVEIPNEGALPNVVVDRSVFPAVITERTDVAHQYVLESLTSDPKRVRDAETAALAYNKNASVINQAGVALMQTAGNRASYSWVQDNTVGNGNLLVTNGASRPATGPSQTGNRKRMTKEDILAVRTIWGRQEIPLDGRNMLITPDMETDLLLIDEFVRADAYGVSNIPDGAIGRVFGINIWTRSRAVTTTGGDVIKIEDAVAAATDQDAAVFWQKDVVRTAIGTTKIFVNLDVAEHFGGIFSSEMRFQGRKARDNNEGIIVLAEDTI